MKYNQLKTVKKRQPKRVGRGISAGQGKTAGRGTKGQNARTGGGVRPGFEGGQNPLYARLPKLRGFTSKRDRVYTIYTDQLAKLGTTITNSGLAEAGLVPHAYVPVKVLLRGVVDKKVAVKLQAASQGAIAAIQKAGGNFTKVAHLKRAAKSSEQK
jgi:large subunit ribosomal protein L15